MLIIELAQSHREYGHVFRIIIISVIGPCLLAIWPKLVGTYKLCKCLAKYRVCVCLYSQSRLKFKPLIK